MQQTLSRRALLARQTLFALGGSLVLAISAQLTIPLLPVPVTFQTMAILALAVFMGPQLAFFATLAYLIEGALGAPVFADFHTGIQTLFGLTGGYLLAMPVGAYLAGLIAQKRTFLRVVAGGVVSAFLILTVGALFLSYFVGFSSAFKYGFAPFVLIEVVKVLAVAAGVALSTRK